MVEASGDLAQSHNSAAVRRKTFRGVKELVEKIESLCPEFQRPCAALRLDCHWIRSSLKSSDYGNVFPERNTGIPRINPKNWVPQRKTDTKGPRQANSDSRKAGVFRSRSASAAKRENPHASTLRVTSYFHGIYFPLHFGYSASPIGDLCQQIPFAVSPGF